MMPKRWEIMNPAPPSLLRRYKQMSPVLAQVLYNRGMRTPEEAYHFLYDKEVNRDPFAFKDMRKAVERITRAIKGGEKIVVYGDFDADGVTATTVMMSFLRGVGANCEAYIPHRVDEGYGLNSPALLEIAGKGASLVITVDCGIRAVQEVADGTDAGLDIIITDHHSVGPEIPAAYAVINPQQEDCNGDATIAGVGVAYMVVRALMLDAWTRNGKQKAHINRYSEIARSLLDLVAIGTVADIMPLNSPQNRAWVRQGLEVMNRKPRMGIRALMDISKVKVGEASAMSIGFMLGPRINAAGRLDHALTAYELLSSHDQQRAVECAHMLDDLNRTRQRLTAEAQARIRDQLASGVDEAHLIFAVDDHVIPGIVGLVAGRLTEEFYRPAIVVEYSDEGCHASCRSIPDFHITRALDECADLLVRHGGHAMAAGLTVLPENLPILQQRLQEKAAAVLDGLDLQPVLEIDMELQPQQMTMNTARELQYLEPTGHKNPPPLFMTCALRVLETRTVGSNDAHLKLKLGMQGAPPIDAIGFRMGHLVYDLTDTIDAVFHLEINEWQGRRNLQLNLQDVRPLGHTVEATRA